MSDMHPDRRTRVLAELGIVRWRLRERASGAVASTVAAATPALPAAKPGLRVAAPDATGAPVDPIAATIWSQVLAWLGHGHDDVAWCAMGERDAVVLPAMATWRTPDGKRGLWQALKTHARTA